MPYSDAWSYDLWYDYLDGANPSNNVHDTNYTFDPNRPFVKAIWDAGRVYMLEFNDF